MTLKTKILSWLLHHANRTTRSKAFYEIKNRILAKHGVNAGYDVQHIPGKICRSCGGRGVHPKYGNNGKIYDWADCYHCYCGWYKRPIWVILQRIRMGKYTFHQPIDRVYSIKDVVVPTSSIINGYIEHTETKYGDFSLFILYQLYDQKTYWKGQTDNLGRIYYHNTKNPYKLFFNFYWIISKKDYTRLLPRAVRERVRREPPVFRYQHDPDEELPF